MHRVPGDKYRPFAPIPIPDRAWPSRTITAPPTWCSVDLRDGNQALIEPMDAPRKRRMFEQLVRIGFKEVEVGFPSASQTDFDFVRELIEQRLIPEDVTVQVLTQARADLILRTFESLRGVPRAIVHLYNSTSTTQRRVVFRLDRAGIVAIAVRAAALIRDCAAREPGTEWTFQYSPESFTGTELDFAVEICDAVTAVWQPTPQRRAILNLPATVELATPNVYADQIEWFGRHVARRDAVIVSVHPHNDRGTGVAALAPGAVWDVPYLPIDPADLGRSYESIIRVNSQSGKGGVAFLLERDYQLVLPRRLQIEFSRVVQEAADLSGRELTAQDLWELFEAEYLAANEPLTYVAHRLVTSGDGNDRERISLRLSDGGRELSLQGSGTGPIDAAVRALGFPIDVVAYDEHSCATGSDAQAVAYVEISTAGTASVFGVARHANIVTASLLALLSAVNRAIRRGLLARDQTGICDTPRFAATAKRGTET